MEQRRLGTSGLKVSAIGLGCNNFGMRISQEETQVVVDAALDHGITFFDTADVYGGTQSEVFLGAALKGKRDKAVVATKFAMGENAGGCWLSFALESLDRTMRKTLCRMFFTNLRKCIAS